MINKGNAFTLTIAILGALKLVLNAFGYDLITDAQVNDLANGIATLVTVLGVLMTHRKAPIAPAVATSSTTASSSTQAK